MAGLTARLFFCEPQRHLIDLDQRYCLARLLRGAMERVEHRPGEPASCKGRSTEHAVLGSPTGKVVEVEQGEELPIAPRGFTWRHVPSDGVPPHPNNRYVESVERHFPRVDALIREAEAVAANQADSFAALVAQLHMAIQSDADPYLLAGTLVEAIAATITTRVPAEMQGDTSVAAV